VKSRLLLDVVIREGSTVFKLLTGEDEALLVWGDALLVLDLSLDVLDGVAGLDIKSDCFASEGLDEDLHTSAKSEDQVKSRLLLDVVVREGSAVFELLTGEDEALLVWGDALLVLDLSLDVLDGVAGLDIKSDCFAGEGLDEDLHTSAKSEDQVKGRLLLNVVVGEGSAVFELLAGEDEALLVWGDALLVLDLSLDVLDGVAGLDIKGDCFSCESLYENLH